MFWSLHLWHVNTICRWEARLRLHTLWWLQVLMEPDCSSHTWGDRGESLPSIFCGIICLQSRHCLLEVDTILSLSGDLTCSYTCSDPLCDELILYLPGKNGTEINFKSLRAALILSEIPHITWKEIWWLGGFPLAFNLNEEPNNFKIIPMTHLCN